MTSRTPIPPEPAVALREILAFDDSGTLRLLLAPGGQDVGVRAVAVGDEGPAQPLDGCLVLVVGVPAASAGAAGPVREAARRGACGVVLRDAEGTAAAPEVLAAAKESGIALLTRAEWADWTDTAALLRSALACARAGRGEEGAAVPDGGAESLAALAAAIAEYTGGSITIEDTRFRVLAHSATGPEADGLRRSTILGGRVPDWRVAELRRSGMLRALWTSRDVIHRAADADGPERLVVAVRSGPEVLGSIWAAADGRGLSPRAVDALRRGAEAAAPHLVRHRLRESGAARRSELALRGLLYGEGDARTHAWSLGLSPDAACAVVVAERDFGAPAGDRTLDVLALQAVSYRPSVRVLRDGDRLLVLLPVDTGQEHDVLGLARELATLALSLPTGVPVRAGAGPVAATALRTRSSCEEAALIVRVLRERADRGGETGGDGEARRGGETDRHGRADRARYADAAGVGPSLDVVRVLDAVRPVWEAGSGPVHDLVRADLAAGGELVRSLAAYLEASGDVARAAARLVVHPNTLRYRLRRARERFGVDLDDPDTRLLITLAVRLTG
ncbi:helix-turn-helix domain-containing protein [Streptomyces laculatispora]|uniref:Helix-turn-helix domain-containing protein n=1 Tax=Streptomyces laculatispora TaxID=887464 RepID=A0ABY9HX31_9ACTN|nr:helix-turn-helix domain-containing protein [Streptomyces laculatispora]WLQ39137.1 helix-turn-helix domain-containing protein [Streptomyces laculatispora]